RHGSRHRPAARVARGPGRGAGRAVGGDVLPVTHRPVMLGSRSASTETPRLVAFDTGRGGELLRGDLEGSSVPGERTAGGDLTADLAPGARGRGGRSRSTTAGCT